MLHALKDFFDALITPVWDPSSPVAAADPLHLATAVLLVEVMRADPAKPAAERQAVVAALQRKFKLDETALVQLLGQAEQAAENAYDYQRFTATINELCTQDQKVQIVEAMWQVAYADGYLDAHENHVISKVAGLLYVTHGEYIAAKLWAKEAASLD